MFMERSLSACPAMFFSLSANVSTGAIADFGSRPG
jgi:hypothetical protein